MKRSLVVGILAGLTVMVAIGRAAGPSGVFPEVSGWTLTPGEKTYTRTNLWDIIDGAADVFLSYGFIDLSIARYEDSSGTDVRIELYRHSSRANAFGIYSQERNPDYRFIDVGTQGYIEDGVLNFLCGTYYVKLTSQRAGREGREAMMLLALRVEEHLKQAKGLPATLTLLPTEGRLVNSEAYVAESFLGYAFLHSAYVAGYEADTSFKLFIIVADAPGKAQEMINAYRKAAGQPFGVTEEGRYLIADPYNGNVHLLWRHRYLCGVLNCSTPKVAEQYLGNLDTTLSGMVKQ